MTRSRWAGFGLLWISLLFFVRNVDVPRVLAQSTGSSSPIQLIPRTKEDRERIYRDEHRISLNVHVTDSAGMPVTGLKPSDFMVFDNQKSQKIYRFREVDGRTFTVRTHVIVVLDGINDEGSSFEHVKNGLDQFLGEDTRQLPFPLSLFFLSSVRTFETRATTDRAAIASELAQLARIPRDHDCEQPKLSVYEGVGTPLSPTPKEVVDCRFNHFSESIRALRAVLGERQNARVRDRTILIWTGQGWPDAVLAKGNYGDLLAELNTNLRRAHVTLDALSLSDFNAYQGLKTATGKVPRTPDDIAAEAMRLPMLAEQNGGQAVAKARNFAEAMSSFMNDANDFYMLSFDSAPAAAADEFHAIRVNVDRPGTKVRTTTSYYAQP